MGSGKRLTSLAINTNKPDRLEVCGLAPSFTHLFTKPTS